MGDVTSDTFLGLHRMVARDRLEPHRVASSLELLFDLVFVVAVSQASQNLHHLLGQGSGGAIMSYLMVFFAVWWAWMNFTWFASAFDTDDWAYRVMTIVQMAGVLVLAAGVGQAMAGFDFVVVTWGYVIMRLAMVGQWLRAGTSDAAVRRTAFSYAVGIGVVQVAWVARIYLLDATGQFITFFVLAACELLVPVVAERQGRTSWHPHHIGERYGLFTLILLGESILAAATAIFSALDAGGHLGMLLGLSAAGLVIAAGMWWVYFSCDQAGTVQSGGFVFGYTHYLVFAAAGAVSAGIEIEIDRLMGHTALTAVGAGLALTVPVGVFVLAAWAILVRPYVAVWTSATLVALAMLIVVAALVPDAAPLLVAGLLAAIVAVLVVDSTHRVRSPG